MSCLPPELVAEWGDNERDPETLSHGSSFKANWVCGLGHEWRAQVKHRVRGSGCPFCANKRLLPGFNDLATRFPEVAAEWHPTKNPTGPEQVMPGSKRRVWWLGECGHEWDQPVTHRTLRGYRCPYCTGRRVLPGFNDLATRYPGVAAEWDPRNPTDPDQVMPTAGATAWWVGPCGHTWETTPANRVGNKTGCPFCAPYNGKVLSGVNDLATLHPELASEWHPTNPLPPSAVLPGTPRVVRWVCDRSHEWDATVGSRVRGAGCRYCANNGTSRAEQELAEFVRSLGVRITTHNRKIAPGYEFDIAVPEKKIAIEYNGLYWHSEKHKPRNYHRDKMQAAQEAGWSVVHVWEDDPLPVIRSMLARKLGVSTEPRYNARSLQKGDVGRVEAREFLNANHVQGYSPGSVRLGLREDNTLVALMLFRSRGEGVWELSRYATAGLVRGGFTRLLTTFVKEHRPTQVVSFSDNTVSVGGVYEQAGFTRDGEIAPDYSYLVGGRRVHKFNYRLNRFRTDPDLKFEPGLTEKELADLNGLPRIYDAGKVRWVLNTLC